MSAAQLFIAVVAYCIGSIPVGLLVAKAKGIDITAAGSGNVGATNVARVVGKKAGIITLLCDVLKGVAGVVVGLAFGHSTVDTAIAAVAVVAGHCFSIPTIFKGGKGVATALGVIMTMSPLSGALGVLTFVILIAMSRIVSLASVTSALVIPLVAMVLGVDDATTAALAIISLIVVFRHQANLQRLVNGTEPKFSFGGKSESVR